MQEETEPTCRQCGATFAGSTIDSDASCPKCRDAATIAPFDPDATRMPTSGPVISISHVQVDPRARLDRYENQEKIGQWQYGDIYSGFHAELNCDVLIHTFAPREDVEDPEDLSLLRERYIERIKAVAQATSPCLPRVMEAGVFDGKVFVVQPAGTIEPIKTFSRRNFFGRWREGVYPSDELVDVVAQVIRAVREMHAVGVAIGSLGPDRIGILNHGQPFIQGVFEHLGGVNLPEMDAIKNDLEGLARAFVALACPRLAPERLSADNPTASIVKTLRWHNSGLPTSLCSVLAGCISRQTGRIESADSALIALSEVEPSGQIPRARFRFFSAFLDFALAAILVGLQGRYLPSDSPYRMVVIPGVVVLLFVIQESLLGTTFVRWFFSLYTYEYSGQRARFLRRFCRVLFKWMLMMGAVVAAAYTVVWLRRLSPSFKSPLLSSACAVSFPIFAVFAPLLFRLRLTLYDALAGATWAQRNTGKSSLATGLGLANDGDVSDDLFIDQVDQYRILKLLGAGGMGQVYLAYDEIIERQVAIKVLPADFVQDGDAYLRFQREARLAAKIRHSKIASVLGFGKWGERPYIAMELVQGKDLSDFVEENGPQSVAKVWDLLIQAVEGLEAASENGVIHRDIKPSNLMLDRTGCLKVMDFGISFDPSDTEDESKSGMLIGTPTYMSPEQADRREVDFRSDMYSLGLTAIFLLTGKKPFVGDTLSVLAQKLEGIDLSKPEFSGLSLNPEQQFLIYKMVETKFQLRFSSYSALKSELLASHPSKLTAAMFTQRVAATVVDGFLFYTYSFVVTVLVRFLTPLVFPALPRNIPLAVEAKLFLDSANGVASVSSVVAFSIFSLFYFLGMLNRGQSPGKRMLGLVVRKNDLRALGIWDTAVRYFVTFPYIGFTLMMLSLRRQFSDLDTHTWLLGFNFTLLVISGLLVLFDRKNRSIGDWLTGSEVFHRESSK